MTNESRALYCHLLADHHLNRRLGRPAAAFAAGAARVLPLPALRLFSPAEFNLLLGGGGGADGSGFDVEDLRAHTEYGGGYSASSRPVKLFWDVMRELPAADRAAVLRFVTASGRAPLGGFRHLTPPFTIRPAGVASSSGAGAARGALAAVGLAKDVALLPSASTCFCLLKLPPYATKKGLRDKLLYAARSGAGFELS